MRTVFERLDLTEFCWQSIEEFQDRTLFQSTAWLEFLSRTQQGEPVLAALKGDDNILGYFTGFLSQKYGLRILGSPFPGWTTSYMGFNLVPGVPRRLAMQALAPFAFNDLGCVHVEVMDRHARYEDGHGYKCSNYVGYEIDLRKSKDDLYRGMTSTCRRCIRKAEKVGVVIEEVCGLDFADEYYNQLQEVFARQGLVPTYGVERVRELIRMIGPTGNLLLLRARDPSGRSIATGIFPADTSTMYFWGGASRTEFRILRPNEAIQWYAIRYWKGKGVQSYDMGGRGDYKKKYGGKAIVVPWFNRSRYRTIYALRNIAERLVRVRQLVHGTLRVPFQIA